MRTLKSRRKFLKGSGTLLFAAAATSPQLAVTQTRTSDRLNADLYGEDYWQMVREQFSFREEAVPMNAANLCPSFRAVADSVEYYTADIDRDCSFNNRAKFGDLLENARTLIANQLNVTANELALVRNTSEANNIINGGLQLDHGDEILVWDQNHPTNNIAWKVRAERFGLTVKSVSTPKAPSTADELVTSFTSTFTQKTRVLALTHVSNITGVKLPVSEIIAAAHASGIYVHIDGAQVWGALDLDLKALDVDSFTASAHKWYMGPKEVGLLYVKEANIDRIWPGVVAPGWGDHVETTLRGARKFESLGQRDDAALAGLGVAAGIHDTIGPKRIERRIRELTQRLKSGINDLGLQLITPTDPELSTGVCIIQSPPGQRGDITNRLYTEHGLAGAAAGGVRFSPTIYNTTGHIDRAITAIETLMV